MADLNVSIDVVEEGQPRVAVTLPDPARIAAVLAALLALWKALQPIIGAASSGGGVASVIAALGTGTAATTPPSADASSPATTPPAPPVARPANPGPGARR